MYVNKCIKCGREFETKNPKRVICPDCLYPDKNMMIDSQGNEAPKEQNFNPQTTENESAPQFYSSYSAGGEDEDRRPPRQYNNQNGYNHTDLVKIITIIVRADTEITVRADITRAVTEIIVKEVKDHITTIDHKADLTTDTIITDLNKADLTTDARKITDLIATGVRKITGIRHLSHC